jgi:glycosyltransferase involved in cell wall biosynthesis
VAAALEWAPDVVFSHNMRALDAEETLLSRRPVVKMIHGYVGTCVSGLKMHAFPRPVACGRTFGPACAVLYLPRRCGQLRVGALARGYGWAARQRALLPRYAAVVVSSEHMHAEYLRHGVSATRMTTARLFAPDVPPHAAPMPARFRVVFMSRMTTLKGGDALVRAVALASRTLGESLAVTLAGDGPARAEWQALARALGVQADFPGWIEGEARAALYAGASVVAVPSLWPEPFGLTGLEGGAYGAAAVGFDVGGIGAWLVNGENGWLVDPRRGAEGLAQALVEARQSPEELARRRAGARAMAERLSLVRHVDQIEAVLAAAAGRT